jgi:7-dehydrocholesterol reductase
MLTLSVKKIAEHHLVRTIFGPLFLMTVTPSIAILVFMINKDYGGSCVTFFQSCQKQGFFHLLFSTWAPLFFGSKTAWAMIGSFACFQIILMKCLPGSRFEGPITPKGNIPVYKANGLFAFIVSMASFLIASYGLKLFSPSIIYDNFGALLGALNVFSLLFCLGLYFKGKYRPSSTDSGTSGNPIFDYYWGTELYPRFLGIDIKMFTNCRFGMMSWSLICLSFLFKQYELGTLSDSMIVSCALQIIYCTKFFIWETGYLRSLDIMHDRAGYYICWGCLVWVPAIYTSCSQYLVLKPIHLGLPLALSIFILGVLSIFINYAADKQRQHVRATNGKCLVFGKKPEIIPVSYVTEKGEKKQTLLLASGFWGIARHFHYVPEILAAFFWALPALATGFLAYFYVIFLTLLLLDRAQRDDKRCAKKYGTGWDKYCKVVPYKILPKIY